MTNNEITLIVDEIVKLGNQAKKADGFEYMLAEAFPAAEESQLNELEAQLKISPSFLTLLSVYNGISNFEWMDLSVLSADYLIEHPNLASDWEVEDWGAVDFKEDELVVFGQADNDSHLLAFDLSEIDENGEFKVVHFDSNGMLGEYVNLEAYLTERLEWFRANF